VERLQERIIDDFRGKVWKQGYLTKEGRRYKSWKRRFFVLRNGQLEYYTKDFRHDTSFKGRIVMHKSSVKYLGFMMTSANSSAHTGHGNTFDDEDSDYDDTTTSTMDTLTSVGTGLVARTGRKAEINSYMYKFVIYDDNRALHMAAKTVQDAKAWVQAIANCISVENYYYMCKDNNSRALLPIVILLSKGNEPAGALESAAAQTVKSDISPAHIDSTKLDLHAIQPFTFYMMKSLTECVLQNRYCSMLNTLKITACDMNDDFMLILSEALSTNRSITSLDLSHNRIGDKGCGWLCDGLLINTMLKHLDMSYNEFGDAGVVYISDLLMSNISLVTVNLSKNKIGKEGVHAISRAMLSNTTLLNLNLSYSIVDKEAAEYLAKGLKGNKSLTNLSLDYCSIDSAGMDALCHGVMLNKTLKELDLRGNVFNKDGASALIAALKDHKSLVRVDVGSNESLDGDGVTVLAQALKSRFLISKLVMQRKK
jgi:Ran GTPase-activating protein (RanGAP) involved in mRNA processing and transport